MRLMNTAATTRYVLNAEREPAMVPDPDHDARDGTPAPQIENSKAGEPVDGATVWVLRALTSREEGALQDDMFDVRGATVTETKEGGQSVGMNFKVSPSLANRNRIRLALVGWENLYDHDGTPVEFKSVTLRLGAQEFKAVDEALIDKIPVSVQTELIREVREISMVSASAGKR